MKISTPSFAKIAQKAQTGSLSLAQVRFETNSISAWFGLLDFGFFVTVLVIVFI
jgi:hypothetical protein